MSISREHRGQAKVPIDTVIELAQEYTIATGVMISIEVTPNLERETESTTWFNYGGKCYFHGEEAVRV